MKYLLYVGTFLLVLCSLNYGVAASHNEFTPRLSEVRRSHTASWTEEYGYVDVRQSAHMFYWLQYTTHPDGYKKRPLVFWLQGGPGAGSSGHGNFEIIGPQDIFGTYNNDTWLQSVSIVYLDSPVGAGFSYVDTSSAYCRNLKQMSDDLVAFSKVFFTNHGQLQTVPLYIIGESYGGKVAAGFGQALNKAVTDGDVKCNLKGYVMGDAWTSPMDSVNTWGPYLHEMSVLDEVGLAAVEAGAARTQAECDAGRWNSCTDEWGRTERIIWAHSNYVSFYNILEYETFSSNGIYINKRGKKEHSTRLHPSLGIKYDTMLAPYQSDTLKKYMNKEVREMVGVVPDHVSWGSSSGSVFQYNEGDFMKDCLDIGYPMAANSTGITLNSFSFLSVDDTLNNTNLEVVVYQGQLDLICDTKGAMLWTQRLKWPGLKSYNSATREALTEPLNGQTDSYVKAYQNFKFYWMLRAGHMVPADMGPASLRMLERITGNVDR